MYDDDKLFCKRIDKWKGATASSQQKPFSEVFAIADPWHTMYRIVSFFYSYVKPFTWGLKHFLANSIIEIKMVSWEGYVTLTRSFYGLPV